jgi:hypothetical protein
MSLKISKIKSFSDSLYKRLSAIILAYAYDNVSADKLFKENIYLLG